MIEEEDDGLQEVIDEFVAESYEGLDQVENDLVVLEADPTAEAVLARVFRALHTIKGTCSFLDFGSLESLSHSAETVLSKMRDGSLVADAVIIDALLASSDAIRAMLGSIENEGHDRPADYAPLRRRLDALAAGETPADEDVTASAEPPAAEAPAEPTVEVTEEVAAPTDTETADEAAAADGADDGEPATAPAEAPASVEQEDDDDDDGMGEIIQEFVAESYEGLDQVDQDLVVLESAPENREVLDRIFRAIHTIKGTCSFLDFPKLEWLSHAGENLLSRLRDKTMPANKDVI